MGQAREDIAPTVGRRFIVQCDLPGCTRAVLIDPRKIFSSPREWPAEGRTERFRCQCGSRVARISWTRNADQAEGPVAQAALALWF